MTTTERCGGATRHDTSASIAQFGIDRGWCRSERVTFGYATGANFPDALAGASALGARGGCLMLVSYAALPGPVEQLLSLQALKGSVSETLVLGGKMVLSDRVVTLIHYALTPPYYE